MYLEVQRTVHARTLPSCDTTFRRQNHFEAAATPTQQHLHSAASPPSFSTPRSYLICRLHRAALIRKTGLLTAAALRSFLVRIVIALTCRIWMIVDSLSNLPSFVHSFTHYSVNLSQVSDQSRFRFFALIIVQPTTGLRH